MNKVITLRVPWNFFTSCATIIFSSLHRAVTRWPSWCQQKTEWNYRNAAPLFPTACLTENTQWRYEIYSTLLPVRTAAPVMCKHRKKASVCVSNPHCHPSVTKLINVLINTASLFLKVIQQLVTPSSSSSRHFYLSLNNVFRKQFLRKMWPIQIAFLLFTVCRIFLSFLTLRNTSSFDMIFINCNWVSTRSIQLSSIKAFRYFWSTFRSVQVSAQFTNVAPDFFLSYV